MAEKLTYEELEKRIQELTENQNKYKLITETIVHGVQEIDTAGKILFANSAFHKMGGYKNGDLIGKSMYDLFPEDADLKQLRDHIKMLIQKQPKPEPWFDTMVTKNGNLLTVQTDWNYKRNKHGDVIGFISIISDITQRKQSETILQEKEEKYRLLFETVINGIQEIDMSGKIVSANSACHRMLGYKKGDLKGRSMFEFIANSDQRTKLQDNIHILKQQKIKPKTWLGKIKKKNGDVFDSQTDWNYKRNTHGEITGFIFIFSDITERKQTEEMLWKSKEQYRILVENNPHGIQEIDCNGKILFANRKHHQMLGCEGQSLIGQSLVDIQAPGPLRDELPRYLEMLIKDKPLPTTYCGTVLTKQGEEKNVEVAWNYQLNTEKNVTGFISVLTDITERKKTEKALKIKDYIIDSASSIIATCDFNGILTFVNPLFFKKTGYNPEEVIGKHFPQIWSVGEYYEEIMNTLSKKGKWKGELEINKKDGSKINVQVSAATIFDENQNPIGLMSSSIDITERKELEEQLRQAHKMESIGTLAGGIAHDFNNLLHTIIGNTELALEDIPEWNPVHESLEEIKSASLRAAGVVKRLLNFSRKTGQNLKPIGAVTVIKDALKFLRSTISSTVKFKLNLPDADIPIQGDSVQINQVMMNLCTNASQVMQDIGGTIEIDVRTVSLNEEDCGKYTNLSAGNHIKITVKDSGPGIAPDIIDKIFDPYFTTKEFGAGSGMGLAVVHGIVKNHDGAITVDSIPGQGATFEILFPVIDELPMPEIEAKEDLPHGIEAILFVDDEEAIANMTGKTLKRLGYQIETQLNPVEALELFKAKPDSFDLVITDMAMPQMTGVNLAKKLKEIRPDIPVIICTGHSPVIDKEKSKQIGIDGFVMKPVSKLKIAKAIRDVLDK